MGWVITPTTRTRRLQARDPPTALDRLIAAVEASQRAIGAAADYERELKAAWRELPDDDPKKDTKPSDWASRYSVRGLASATEGLVSWLV